MEGKTGEDNTLHGNIQKRTYKKIIFTEVHIYQKKTKKNMHNNDRLRNLYTCINPTDTHDC